MPVIPTWMGSRASDSVKMAQAERRRRTLISACGWSRCSGVTYLGALTTTVETILSAKVWRLESHRGQSQPM